MSSSATRLSGLKEVRVVDGEEYGEGTNGRAQLSDGAHPNQRLAALATHYSCDAQLGVADHAD